MNVHLSSIVSEVLDPLAEHIGKYEVISSEDLLNHIDDLNEKLKTMTSEKTEKVTLIGADAEGL